MNSKRWRRWNLLMNRALRLRLEDPRLFILAATIVILCLQLILSSPTIYCGLPNLRALLLSKAPLPSYEKLPIIYAITPTYARPVQKAELVRLSQTLLLVPNLHWIIVEDNDKPTEKVRKLVHRLKSEFQFHEITQLAAPTPANFKLKPGEPSWSKPKGVWQRNCALDWVEENLLDLDFDGVLYFADDDNTYDLEVFHEMRYTRHVSVWPVGLAGGLLVERPLVGKTGRVESFNSMWERQRPFPIDMAGFAIGMRHFMTNMTARFSANQRIGYVESDFLRHFVTNWHQLEPKADRCSKVLVWHTRTQMPQLHEERKLLKPSHEGLEW